MTISRPRTSKASGRRVREPARRHPLGRHDQVRARRERRLRRAPVPQKLDPIQEQLLQVHQEPDQALGRRKADLPGLQTPRPGLIQRQFWQTNLILKVIS